MVVHSWSLIEKLCLAFIVVLGVTWLWVLLSFDLILNNKSSYLVHMCLIGWFDRGYFVIDYFSVLFQSSLSLKYFIRIGIFYLALISYFSLMDLAHNTRTDLCVYWYIISHISSDWYRHSNPFYFQDLVIWTPQSVNMDSTSVEYVWPHLPWLYWIPLFHTIIELCWAYY